MDNEMKERLIDTIAGTYTVCPSVGNCNQECLDCKAVNEIAEVILADGWVRPKFKVGQEVWYLHRGHNDCSKGKIHMYSGTPTFLLYHVEDALFYREEEVFATEAEAMAALREGDE